MKLLPLWVYVLAALWLPLGCEIGIEQPPPAATGNSADAEGGGHTRVARGHLQFVEGYAQGYNDAVRQSKPLLLYFTASWCEYCHQMAEEAFIHPEVVALSRHFVCVLVDADVEADVCRQFAVTGYPTIQFLSPRGVPLERVVGKRPGHQVMMAMQAALQHVARRTDADDGMRR